MTRSKKSRKPGRGSSGSIKSDNSTSVVVSDKKPKKKTGKVAGNRQQEAVQKNKTTKANAAAKDPRIGSKKPIDLGKPTKVEVKAQKQPKAKTSAIAKVRVVEQGPTIAQQLATIENDERLQLILAKQEDEQALTEEEVAYYNELMEQYETLSAQLPPEETESEDNDIEDEDLLDKLDTSDFSDYE